MEIGEKTIKACQENIDALLEFGREEMNRVFTRDKALVVAMKIKFAPVGELVKCKASIKFTTDEFEEDTDFTVMEKQGELFLEQEGAALVETMPMEEGKKEYKLKEKVESPAFFSPPDCHLNPSSGSCDAVPIPCQTRYLCCLQCIDPCVIDRCKEAKARAQA